MSAVEKRVWIFCRADGRQPFQEWMDYLRDPQAKQKIQVRIDRLQLGNPGSARSVGAGVMELKIDHGPGYRVYFAQDGDSLVILLCGGDKSSQDEDIKSSKSFWKDYKKRKASHRG